MDNNGHPQQVDFPIMLCGKEYKLSFPIGAIWAFEDMTGEVMFDDRRSPDETIASLEAMPLRKKMERTVFMLKAGLVAHHPDVTLDQLKAMITLRNFAEVSNTVWSAFNASMPQAEGGGAQPDPLATTTAQG